MTRARRAAGRTGAAAAAVLLLGGCHGPVLTEEQRRAIEAARERNAFVGAAVALLLILAVRHVTDSHDETRPTGSVRPVVVGRMPGPLLAAMLSSEVTGMLLLAAVGAFVGYVVGPAPSAPGDHDLDATSRALLGLLGAPVFSLFTLIGVSMLRLTHRLPMVRTATFGWAAVWHAVATLLGVAVALGQQEGVDAWNIAGAALAGTSLVGLAGYCVALGARSQAKREARARLAARSDW